MFKYGNLQSPNIPAPQASIKLSNPLEPSQSCQVDAIVDTGALMTCIPELEIKQLGKSLTYSTIKVREPNGNILSRKTYFIDILIADYEHKNIEVIAISKKYALIGRDILNQHKVILDAPNQRWSLNGIRNNEII